MYNIKNILTTISLQGRGWPRFIFASIPRAIYPEIRNLQNQINQEGPQVPNQVNETMHQRQPPPSNANTTEQPPVQAEGNNEQRETETREPVSGNQVSESGKTGPLTTP
ncbi:Hypothetical_protein [Hexamita inflata]|uniref:Hypothetical_protein n=1 Tax=Hexamita inflata TaxID=28002 RepID=A0AA86R6B2_9EUKA|nr:Hypothetical protein HINF_LOCUS54728 [Hexamita inflata]